MFIVRRAVVVAVLASIVCGSGLAQNSMTQDMDRSVKPGDDFYRYANGEWLKTTAIPAGVASYGTGTMLAAKTSERVRALVVEAASAGAAKGSLSQKVGDYYASFLDEDGIEANGMSPLAGEMAAIAAIGSKRALSSYLGGTLGREADGLTANADHVFGVWVNQGFEDTEHNLPHLWQGGLGMPDREAYLDASPKGAELRAKYRAHIAVVLTLAGVSDADAKAERVLALEIGIAKSHAPDSEAADVFKQNNPWKRTEFAANAPGMDWDAYFKSAGLMGQADFLVWQPAGVVGTAALVASEPLAVWRDYLRFHLVEHYASVLPKAVRSEEFAFYGTALTGAEQMPERGVGAIAAVNGAVGEAVGQLYVKQYFSPQAKAKALAMVADLRTAFLARIANSTWMSEETRKKALAKMEAFQIGIGYPDVWIDFAKLDVVRGDAFGNARRAEAFYRAHDLARLRQPVYPVEWPVNPQVPGGVIMFSPNFEVFSAGILQPPFFDPEGDAASNYGSAGAGIAHEISHSFDESGNIYDAHGRLVKWWTAEDEGRYHAAAATLVAQFDKYCPYADACVNGKQVLTESIANVTGLVVAHDAYVLSLKGKPDAVTGGLTGEQRFFVAYSQRWRRLQTEAATRRQIATDTHPPGEFISDTVRNVESWYEAFEVTQSDTLYVKPEDRFGIW